VSATVPIRFFVVAVATTAALYLILRAIGVRDPVLQRDAIVLALFGVVVALIVEAVLSRTKSSRPRRRPRPPAPRRSPR
jgi:hypothetical protein